jgi:4-amino-4-deoxy-L-arabinose transferase-like glycosyltransferase
LMNLNVSLLTRAALAAAIAWFLWLPLGDVLAYPTRISVLSNLEVDAAAYDAIGRAVAATWTLDAFPVRHPPVWPALLAVVYGTFGASYVAGKLISWVALAGCIALSAWIAKRVYGEAAAWAAALVCASSPALRAYVGTLQYEVTAAFFALALLALAVRAAQSRERPSLFVWSALAGLIGGLLVLTREPFALLIPMTALWIGGRVRDAVGIRSAALAAVLTTAIAAAPAIGWSALQSMRDGRLIVISDKGPIVFDLGYNPLANGTYNAPLVGIIQPTGLAFITQFPRRTLILATRKWLYLWGVLRDGWNVPHPATIWIWRASGGLLPPPVLSPIVRGGWLLGAFVVALWMLGREGLRRWWILPASVLAVLAVHVGTLASYRFAVPTLPIVYVIVSGPLATLAVFCARALRPAPIALASAFLGACMIAMQFADWPLNLHYDAVRLDGIAADNRVDPISGRPARMADAARGQRPIVLLADEYLPSGEVTMTIGARLTDNGSDASSIAVARAALLESGGRIACERTISALELRRDRFESIEAECRLARTGPTTFTIDSLGTADLAIDDVALTWTLLPSRPWHTPQPR